jgi:hypothetical protein
MSIETELRRDLAPSRQMAVWLLALALIGLIALVG